MAEALSREEGRAFLAAPKKRHKYNIQRDSRKSGKEARTIDGHVFDSLKEAQRYCHLKVRQKNGEIQGLMVGRIWPLYSRNGQRICAWESDLDYIENSTMQWVVEDVKVKPTRTRLFLIKKAWVEADYGVVVREV